MTSYLRRAAVYISDYGQVCVPNVFDVSYSGRYLLTSTWSPFSYEQIQRYQCAHHVVRPKRLENTWVGMKIKPHSYGFSLKFRDHDTWVSDMA